MGTSATRRAFEGLLRLPLLEPAAVPPEATRDLPIPRRDDRFGAEAWSIEVGGRAFSETNIDGGHEMAYLVEGAVKRTPMLRFQRRAIHPSGKWFVFSAPGRLVEVDVERGELHTVLEGARWDCGGITYVGDDIAVQLSAAAGSRVMRIARETDQYRVLEQIDLHTTDLVATTDGRALVAAAPEHAARVAVLSTPGLRPLRIGKPAGVAFPSDVHRIRVWNDRIFATDFKQTHELLFLARALETMDYAELNELVAEEEEDEDEDEDD